MFKKNLFIISITALVAVWVITKVAKRDNVKLKPLSVVNEIDLNKYMGLWYEIAYIPAWFQKNCAGGTTAEYSLNGDGTVKVVNTCYTADKQKKQAIGRAWVVDAKTRAKLKVSFAPGKSKLFAGDYWIIDIGPEYEYAVVGHPKRNFGWILSRKKELPEDVLKGIISRIEAQGYDFSKFSFTNQKDYGK